MKKETSDRKISLCITSALLIVLAVQYWCYVDVAKTTIPFMDFWHWIALYGEKVQDGTIRFWDFFNSDLGEHIQPIGMAINFISLKWAGFDVVPSIEIGTMLRIVMALALVTYFDISFKKIHPVNDVVKLITEVALFLCVINYNQWEMTTEPFNLSNVYRVANYYLSFIWADHWLANMEKCSNKKNLLCGIIFGCFCSFLTLFVGAAYFVGHLMAIGLACLWILIQRKHNWKSYFGPMFIWGVISFIGAVGYVYLLLQRKTQIESATLSMVVFAINLIQGICLFWGSVLVATPFINDYGSQFVAILGVVVLIGTIIIFVCYLKLHRDGTGMFPAICFLYAFCISIAITMGRNEKFGINTMCSSRYVVESSIGLFGVIWMAYSLWSGKSKKKKENILAAGAITFFCLMLLLSAKIQISFSPYMKESFENLEKIMRNIDDYTDEELGGFQANNPSDVRYCVKFLKENSLSIFKVS